MKSASIALIVYYFSNNDIGISKGDSQLTGWWAVADGSSIRGKLAEAYLFGRFAPASHVEITLLLHHSCNSPSPHIWATLETDSTRLMNLAHTPSFRRPQLSHLTQWPDHQHLRARSELIPTPSMTVNKPERESR